MLDEYDLIQLKSDIDKQSKVTALKHFQERKKMIIEKLNTITK